VTVTATTSGQFDVDTDVRRAGPGEYTTALSERWNALGGVANGGYLLAVCLRALERELPLPDPLAVSAFFLRPGASGPAEVRTELVRSGRRTATGEARLSQGGREIVRAVATFTDLAPTGGRTVLRTGPPDLPPPADCVDPLAEVDLPGVSILDMVEFRVARVPGWCRGEPDGDPSAEFWMRFADGRDADPLALAALVDAAAPVVLDIGAVGSSTLELTVHVRARPAPGWLACRVATRYVMDGYHEEDFEIWDSQGTLVAQSRQLALLR
jgi:acyl-CoA thioesterase